jgi:hypothetical protein
MGARRRHGVLVALALAAILGVAALALAAANGPKTDAVQASFTAQATNVKTRTCTGQDGTYSATRVRFEGTSTGDERLTGRVLARAHNLINQDTGLGTSRGVLRILDPATGRVKAHAKFSAVVTEGTVLNGFILGHVRPQGEDTPKRDGRLWANFTAQVTPQGAATGELGGGTAENTAVIQSGHCGSPKAAKPKKQHKSGKHHGLVRGHRR